MRYLKAFFFWAVFMACARAEFVVTFDGARRHPDGSHTLYLGLRVKDAQSFSHQLLQPGEGTVSSLNGFLYALEEGRYWGVYTVTLPAGQTGPVTLKVVGSADGARTGQAAVDARAAQVNPHFAEGDLNFSDNILLAYLQNVEDRVLVGWHYRDPATGKLRYGDTSWSDNRPQRMSLLVAAGDIATELTALGLPDTPANRRRCAARITLRQRSETDPNPE